METITRGKSRKAPLVLIHDGGGTTASYHALINLEHDIYGIENPLFHASKPWKGGIPAMARAYSALVELELGQTSVLLGGWSFGGLVALEMVDILQIEYGIDVQGVLLLDSVCPTSWKFSAARNDYHVLSTAYAACLSSKLLVMNMMKQSTLMAEQWQAPQWQSTMSDHREHNCCCAGSPLPSEGKGMSPRRGPLVVLVRCLNRLNPGDKAIARVDISRDCETLGWEHARPGLVSRTVECNANHFNLFTKDFVHETTEKIREALVAMESDFAGFA
ncbi:alpha/beta-hydrolase [Sodiomyces alkalinus F11]|uniref:Alpha/beta-hydrolase n=1 Tax=Sodiomyces alkalinus (strain CBS 110278 / VKM F-3762 / F11) TaxID=1314773 RepID=A0A3N2PYE8_SODAK|nr:alpha/beta-hydrolase [Sodiomyces alkalinus F11]ROT39559.1 alpha/beta-hydrolase [Sodiomyces alkalinus F11]